jgi:3-phenylpropionate/cinnamic acid dioxygenase small subunit
VAPDDLTERELSDRARIGDLLDAYAAAVDARDWEGLRAVFAPDAVLDYSDSGGPKGALEEVLPWLRESLELFAATQHLITNRAIELRGGEATSRSSYFNPMGRSRDDGGLDMLYVGGTYEDRFRRTRDGWRIAERVQTISWMQGGALPGRPGMK